jgi:hypothetical protein
MEEERNPRMNEGVPSQTLQDEEGKRNSEMQ